MHTPVALGTGDDAVAMRTLPHVRLESSPQLTNLVANTVGTSFLGGLYLRGSELVWTARMGQDGYIPPDPTLGTDGPAQVHPVSAHVLRRLFDQRTYLFEDPETMERVGLPADVAARVVATPELCPNLPVLGSVVHTPYLRPDGTVVTDAGYDSATQVLYLPDEPVPAVPATPTDAQVRDALGVVTELFAEFTFASDSHRANYLGLLFLPMLAQIAPPPWQMGLVNASMPGSGKTLLAHVLMTLHGGVHRSALPPTDEEVRKTLTAVLRSTTGRVVIWDNLYGHVTSAELANLLTTREYSSRRLRTSDDVLGVNDRLWIGTGNNVSLGGDLPRRALWVHLNPDHPEPWTRSGFAIRDLKRHVLANRPVIRHAMLTLLRAWAVAGMPVAEVLRSDDYARPTAVLRGLLDFLGVEGTYGDPSTNMASVASDDEPWVPWLVAVHAMFGDREFSVVELHAAMCADDASLGSTAYEVKYAVPPELAPVVNGTKQRSSLGKLLAARQGRWMGGYAIRRGTQDSRTRAWNWQVQTRE